MSVVDQLLAVAPNSTKTIEVSGIELEIKKLSLMTCIKMIRRFPDAMKGFFGGGDIVEAAVRCGPEFIAAAIVASIDVLDNLAEEKKVAELHDAVQLEILAEILAFTMPDGLEDFLGNLIPLAERMGIQLAAE